MQVCGFLALFVVLSVLPDYFSLWKARLLISVLVKARSGLGQFPCVVEDVAASLSLGLGALVLLAVSLAGIEGLGRSDTVQFRPKGNWLGIVAKNTILLHDTQVSMGFPPTAGEFYAFIQPTDDEEGRQTMEASIKAIQENTRKAEAFFSTYGSGFPLGIFLYSTLLTSIWALSYWLSALALRLLIRPVSRIWNIKEFPITAIGFIAALMLCLLYVAGKLILHAYDVN